MVKGQLSGEFFKAAMRTALLVALPIGVAMSSGTTHAGDTTPAKSVAQAQTTVLSSPLEKIEFKEITKQELLKQYPFMKQVAEDQISEYVPPFPDKVLFSDVRDPLRKVKLLFIQFTDKIFCDVSGCPLYVYADNGAGYKKVLDFTAQKPVYLSRDKQNIVFCALQKTREWVRKDGGVFELNKGAPLLSTPPKCEPQPK